MMTTQLKICKLFGLLIIVLGACQLMDGESVNESIFDNEQISNSLDSSEYEQSDISFTENCLSVKEDVSLSFLTTGTLLFNRQTSDDLNQIWSLSRYSKELTALADTPSSAVLSPQGNWLAFYNWQNGDLLQIVGSNQTNTIDRTWKAQWQNGLGLRWLNEEWLVIPSALDTSEKLTLYNPFLDQEKFLTTELPYIYNFRPATQLDGYVLYNKQFSHVVYVGTSSEDGLMLTLLNLEQNQQIWRLISMDAPRLPVAWNMNGNHLAVAGETASDASMDMFEVFLIDLQGKARQVTKFSDIFNHTSINSLSWSPDGNYLAFWVQHRNSFEDVTPYTLHLVDTTTLEVVDTCIPGGVGGPLVWSPDSLQLAFQSGEWMELNTLMILDLPSLQVGQILKESVSLIGWTNWLLEAN